MIGGKVNRSLVDHDRAIGFINLLILKVIDAIRFLMKWRSLLPRLHESGWETGD